MRKKTGSNSQVGFTSNLIERNTIIVGSEWISQREVLRIFGLKTSCRQLTRQRHETDDDGRCGCGVNFSAIRPIDRRFEESDEEDFISEVVGSY